MTQEAAAIEIYNAATPGAWNSLADIQQATGLTQAELQAGVQWWMQAEDFRAEPESHGRRAATQVAVIIGGEPRHQIRFAE